MKPRFLSKHANQILVPWILGLLTLTGCHGSSNLFDSSLYQPLVVKSDIPERSIVQSLQVQVAYNSTDGKIFWKYSWAGNEGKFHDYFKYDGVQWVKEGKSFRDVGSETQDEIVTGFGSAAEGHAYCSSCHETSSCADCHEGPNVIRKVPGFHSLGTAQPISESAVSVAIANPNGQSLSGTSTWPQNFEKYGCFLACHGNLSEMPVWNANGQFTQHGYLMQFPNPVNYPSVNLPDYGSAIADLWYWRAQRTGALGTVDDQHIKQMGRGGDHGDRPWITQKTLSGNPEVVFDPATTSSGLFSFQFDDLGTTPDYYFTNSSFNIPTTPHDLNFGIATALGYTPSAGDTVPRRRLGNASGSRADITGTGSSYDATSGRWNVFMTRDLVPATGDTDNGVTDDVRDVAFADLNIFYYVAFALHADQAAGRDHYVSLPKSLGFSNPSADLNAVQITGAGAVPNFSDTATFPIKVVDLFLPGVTSFDFLIGNEMGDSVGGTMHGGFHEVAAGTNACESCHSVREDDPLTPTKPGGSLEEHVLRRGGVYNHTPISFAHHIKPLLDTRCGTTSCHGNGAPPMNGLFADNVPNDQAYAAVTFNNINYFDPVNSLLLLKPLDAPPLIDGHAGGVIFPTSQDADYVKLLRWIMFNVPNN